MTLFWSVWVIKTWYCFWRLQVGRTVNTLDKMTYSISFSFVFGVQMLLRLNLVFHPFEVKYQLSTGVDAVDLLLPPKISGFTPIKYLCFLLKAASLGFCSREELRNCDEVIFSKSIISLCNHIPFDIYSFRFN